MVPLTPLPLSTASEWDLPKCCTSSASSTWHRLEPWVQCCPTPGEPKSLLVLCKSGRHWMLPLFSLFPLFPSWTLHAPMWEMLRRFEGSRYCFCGDVLKSCDKAILLGYSCVTFESLDRNLLLAFVFWCLDAYYVDALNFLSIVRQLILLVFYFLQDYYDLNCFSHDSWEWQLVTH